MPDQVVARVRQAGKLRGLTLELLHVVFAEVAQSQIVGLAKGVGGKHFGDGQEENSGRIAPRPAGRTRDPFADCQQSVA